MGIKGSFGIQPPLETWISKADKDLLTMSFLLGHLCTATANIAFLHATFGQWLCVLKEVVRVLTEGFLSLMVGYYKSYSEDSYGYFCASRLAAASVDFSPRFISTSPALANLIFLSSYNVFFFFSWCCIAILLKTNEVYLLSSRVPLSSWIATYLGLAWHPAFLFWGELPVSGSNSHSLNSTRQLLNLYNINTGDSVHSKVVHDFFYWCWLVFTDFEKMRKSNEYQNIMWFRWYITYITYHLYQCLLVNFCIQNCCED